MSAADLDGALGRKSDSILLVRSMTGLGSTMQGDGTLGSKVASAGRHWTQKSMMAIEDTMSRLIEAIHLAILCHLLRTIRSRKWPSEHLAVDMPTMRNVWPIISHILPSNAASTGSVNMGHPKPVVAAMVVKLVHRIIMT